MDDYYLNRYAQQYPDMTVKEFVEEMKRIKKETEEQEKIRQENEKKWFEDLIGKYVSIEHNRVSFTVFYVDKIFNHQLSTNFTVFNIYRSETEKKFSIQKENREINKLWLDNPYLIRSYGEKAKMKIITKEEYNNIEKLYNDFSEELKNINI